MIKSKYRSKYLQPKIYLSELESCIVWNDTVYIVSNHPYRVTFRYAKKGKLKYFFASVKGVDNDYMYVETRI